MKVGTICVPAYTIISMAELEGKTYIYILERLSPLSFQ